MVPEGWLKTTLGQLVSIYSGESPSLYDLAEEGRYPYVKVDDLNLSAKYQIGSRAYADSARTLVPTGSILFAKRGAAIMVNKVRIASLPLCMDSNMMALEPKSGRLDSEYLFYFLVREELHRIADTSTIPQINNKHIIPYPIALPPLSEQRAIAALLAIWDRAIEQTTRLIEAKRRLKQGLMQQLLTGARRFQEFVRSCQVQETRFGSLPSDWRYIKVGDVAYETGARNANGADVPVLSCSKYDGLVESLTYFGKRVFSEDTSNYKVVRRGEFAYPSNHVEEGSIGLLDFADAGLVSPIYTVFSVRDDVYASFLYRVFKSDLYLHVFQVNTSASVDRRGSLRWGDFSLIRVPLPSLDEQRKIARCLDVCDREIIQLAEQLQAMQGQKQALMQKLLTGEKRVKIAQEA